MPRKDPEERKAYLKAYYEKNKEQIQENKKEQNKEHFQTEEGKKSSRINNWKQRRVKSEDYNALYEYYLNCKYCENCGVEFVDGDLGANKKCLDHSHKTGLFRNILCNTCNNRRRENNTLLL
jgi:hypothetical protein